jgi:hypothetical protein
MGRKSHIIGNEKEIIDMYGDNCDISKIVNTFKVDRGNLIKFLKENGVYGELSQKEINKKIGDSVRKYIDDTYYFKNIDTDNKAYTLGLFSADGWMSNQRKRFSLKITDLDLLEKIKIELGTNRPLRIERKIKEIHKDTKVLTICNSEMYDDLMSLGCILQKSYNYIGPNIDKKMMPGFIRGFFDADGCMYVGKDKRNNHIIGEMTICSTTTFCQTLYEYFESVGIYSSLFRDKHHDIRISKIRIRRQKDLLKFRDLIYGNMNESSIYLKRKYDKFEEYKQMLMERTNDFEFI